jgi:hypothetical protein
MNVPTIEIKFGTCQQTNEQIKSVYVNCFREAIAAARGNKEALEELNRLSKEAVWMTDSLIYEAQFL